MKHLTYLTLFAILLFQLSCVSYKKEIYRSDSRLNKVYEIIDSLKLPARVKIRLKNGDELRVTIIMLNDKEIYGSTNPVDEIFNKIILFNDIEYVILGENKFLKRLGVGVLVFTIIIGIMVIISYLTLTPDL